MMEYRDNKVKKNELCLHFSFLHLFKDLIDGNSLLLGYNFPDDFCSRYEKEDEEVDLIGDI